MGAGSTAAALGVRARPAVPAGAGMAMLPMILWIQFEAEFFRHPGFVAVFVLGTAALLVSRIPTFSFKKIGILQSWILPTMAAVGLYLALLVSVPWITLSLTIIAYMASIPFGFRAYRHYSEREGEASLDVPAEDRGNSVQ